MNRRQLLILFICSLAPLTTGNGLSALLPAYAADLGHPLLPPAASLRSPLLPWLPA